MYVATPTPQDEFLMHEQSRNYRRLDLQGLWEHLKPDPEAAESTPGAHPTTLATTRTHTGDERPAQGMRVVRTALTDNEVTDALVKELELRQVRVKPDKDHELDHIAVVLECDTISGRSMRYSMAASIVGVGINKFLDDAGPFPQNVHLYTYMRGVDGRLAAQQKNGHHQQQRAQHQPQHPLG